MVPVLKRGVQKILTTIFTFFKQTWPIFTNNAFIITLNIFWTTARNF